VNAIPTSGTLFYDANDRTATDTYDNAGNTVAQGGIGNVYWGDVPLTNAQARPVELWLQSLKLSPKSRLHIRDCCAFFGTMQCGQDACRRCGTRWNSSPSKERRTEHGNHAV
jgi:hypothetical protein